MLNGTAKNKSNKESEAPIQEITIRREFCEIVLERNKHNNALYMP